MENPTQQGASIHDRLMAVLEPENAQETDSVKDDTSTQDTEPDEIEVQEGEESEESETESTEEDVTDETEPPEHEVSTSDLAQYLGIDENLLDVDGEGKIVVKTKIDGQESTAKLQDLIRTHQIQGHLDNETRTVAKQKEALQSKMAELESQNQERFQQLEDLSQMAYQQLVQDYNNVDWATLREEDPAEFAARSQDFQRRQSDIQTAYQQVQAQRQNQTALQQQQQQEFIQSERQKLFEAVPEWTDETIAKKDMEAITSYAHSIGITQEELSQVADHRYALILRDAMRYRNLQSKKDVVSKKVVKAPKIVKPGSPETKENSEQRKLSDLKSAVRKSGGKRGSIAEYLLATGKV